MHFTKYFQNLTSSKNNTTTPSSSADKTNFTLQHLSKIKHLVEKPKEDNPDARFDEIKNNLGEAECYQTIRDERWHPTVYCPNCHSTDIQILEKEQQIGAHNFRYLCLLCRSRFNDDSKTPFEFSMPPLEVWIQCWFLFGCSSSLEYVAAKLNLNLNTVKHMIEELQKLFKIKQPLTRTMSYEEWAKQYSQTYTHRVKEEILTRKAKTELYQGYATGQEKDSAELRRQKNKQNPPPGLSPKNKNF